MVIAAGGRRSEAGKTAGSARKAADLYQAGKVRAGRVGAMRAAAMRAGRNLAASGAGWREIEAQAGRPSATVASEAGGVARRPGVSGHSGPGRSRASDHSGASRSKASGHSGLDPRQVSVRSGVGPKWASVRRSRAGDLRGGSARKALRTGVRARREAAIGRSEAGGKVAASSEAVDVVAGRPAGQVGDRKVACRAAGNAADSASGSVRAPAANLPLVPVTGRARAPQHVPNRAPDGASGRTPEGVPVRVLAARQLARAARATVEGSQAADRAPRSSADGGHPAETGVREGLKTGPLCL